MAEPRVAFARDCAALSKLVPLWEDLAQHALEPNPLYEHWMLLPALAGALDDFCCVLVREGERLDGLFPLQRIRRLSGLPAGGYSSWCHGSWMLGTPLVRAAVAQPTLAAFLDWLAQNGISVAQFCHVPCDGPFHAALADVLRARAATVVAIQSFTRGLLLRDSSAEAYLDSALSRESRKSLRRKENRLRERGEVAHVALAPSDDAARWIEEFLRLEASGWKGKLGSALACSQAGRRFAVETLSAAFARGRLQIIGIDVGGKPVARCCNLLAGEGSYAYRTAYDEDYAYYSPGIMAELDSVRAFHAAAKLQWMDSITDPDNGTINRLWKHRRTMQTLAVGLSTWGETWVSMLPLMRWAKQRVTPATPAVRLSPTR